MRLVGDGGRLRGREIGIGEVFGRMGGGVKHEAIADVLEAAIVSGDLKADDRLPTVRQVAQEMGVSVTTVSAAYRKLAVLGLIRTEVGRGSFVARRPSVGTPETQPAGRWRSRSMTPWRNRMLSSSSNQLRAAYPEALDCSRGRPDPNLLPLSVLKRAWRAAIEAAEPASLEYMSPEPVPVLSDALLPRLERDGVIARENDLVIGSSAQQLIVLSMEVIDDLSFGSRVAVAVEEPGYPTIFDTLERSGHRLVGMETDEYGAVPESLEDALTDGARAVLFTPRAHNPTGASWSAGRMKVLGEILARHPEVFVIEDDQFSGTSCERPGSLVSVAATRDRVVYVRSFSKSIAPDLRIACAVARPRLRNALLQAKVFADGWSPRLAQETLARALLDDELDDLLGVAREEYAIRRRAATEALETGLSESDGRVLRSSDGVNLWVQLPSGVGSFDVVGRAAELGVLCAPGEPFYVGPGHNDSVRLNVGYVDLEGARVAGEILAEAATSVTSVPPPITV